jgi:hypothetical protein
MDREGFDRAPMRPLRVAALAAFLALLASPAAHAQSASPPVMLDDAQVQSFFDSVQRDQALAGAAGGYAPAPSPIVPPAVAPARPAADPASPEARTAAEIGLGLDLDAPMVAEEPPGPVETALLMLAALGVLLAASVVVALAIRHLRREARQSKRTYRRRMHRSRHRRAVPVTEATSH